MWSRWGKPRNVPFGEPSCHLLADRCRTDLLRLTDHQQHRCGDLGQQVPHAVDPAVQERLRFELGVASQRDAVGRRGEAVLDVVAQRLRRERRHRRFRAVVVDRVLVRAERTPPAAGGLDHRRQQGMIWIVGDRRRSGRERDPAIWYGGDRLEGDDQRRTATDRGEPPSTARTRPSSGRTRSARRRERLRGRRPNASSPYRLQSTSQPDGAGVSPWPRKSSPNEWNRSARVSAIGR